MPDNVEPNNFKLMAFMFKMMECYSKASGIGHANSTSLLHCQHQWELEQKKTYVTEAPKVDKNNFMKTMKNIILNLKLIRGMRGTPLAFVVQQHVEESHILSG